MNLFLDHQKVTDVVTAKDIRNLTGIQANDFQFQGEDDDEKALDKLLEEWIKKIGSHIYARLRKSISADDPEYEAIQDVLIRTVAKLIAVSQQQRSSPVIRINDYAINVLNTSEVTKDLDKELRPFRKRTGFINVFSSLEPYKASDE